MKINDWERWLVEEQWRGYRLDEIMFDAPQPTGTNFVDWMNAYQALRSLFILTTGFNGEAGETVEHFKKYIRDGIIDRNKAALELGDRLAYLTWLASTLGFTLEQIAELNYTKLMARGKKEAS
jgi:NTP pyrophosphatase (non-canonical NTP hydrolase)